MKDNTVQYVNKVKQVYDKLKEIKMIQGELLTLMSQAEPNQIDEFEDSTFSIGLQIDDILTHLWILGTNEEPSQV